VSRLLLAAALAAVLAAGCRGQVSTTPPRRLFDDMVWQPKYRPEAVSTFFPDGRAMRSPVAGTVSQSAPLEPEPLPPVDATLARRGQERYDIYCSPCHDRTGAGNGLVAQRGFPRPIDLTGAASERARGLTHQQLYDTISQGARNMPSYAAQIPPRDRWAIVVWVRVLQRSQHAAVADVPAAELGHLLPESHE
jgi:mono/diheme cytochrome c family protein